MTNYTSGRHSPVYIPSLTMQGLEEMVQRSCAHAWSHAYMFTAPRLLRFREIEPVRGREETKFRVLEYCRHRSDHILHGGHMLFCGLLFCHNWYALTLLVGSTFGCKKTLCQFW